MFKVYIMSSKVKTKQSTNILEFCMALKYSTTEFHSNAVYVFRPF